MRGSISSKIKGKEDAHVLNRKFIASTILPLMLFALSMTCASSISAQEAEKPVDSSPQDIACAHPFDEFEASSMSECDWGARLDNLAIELQNSPTQRAILIYYDGVDDSYMLVTQKYYLRYQDYLSNTRGIDASRFKFVEGGYRQQQIVELWLIPEDAPDPVPTDTVAPPQRTGRTYKYNVSYIYLPYDGPEEIAEDEAAPDEDAAPAEDASVGEAAPETLPQAEGLEADTSLFPEAADPGQETESADQEDELAWASEDFAKAVKEQKDARACIIYYVESEDAGLQKMQAAIDRAKSRLVEKYGLKADDIITIYGGYRESDSVELWVAPLEDSLPAPTPHEKRPEEPEEVMKVQ